MQLQLQNHPTCETVCLCFDQRISDTKPVTLSLIAHNRQRACVGLLTTRILNMPIKIFLYAVHQTPPYISLLLTPFPLQNWNLSTKIITTVCVILLPRKNSIELHWRACSELPYNRIVVFAVTRQTPARAPCRRLRFITTLSVLPAASAVVTAALTTYDHLRTYIFHVEIRRCRPTYTAKTSILYIANTNAN